MCAVEKQSRKDEKPGPGGGRRGEQCGMLGECGGREVVQRAGEKARAGDGASELGQEGLVERLGEPLCQERDG